MGRLTGDAENSPAYDYDTRYDDDRYLLYSSGDGGQANFI